MNTILAPPHDPSVLYVREEWCDGIIINRGLRLHTLPISVKASFDSAIDRHLACEGVDERMLQLDHGLGLGSQECLPEMLFQIRISPGGPTCILA